MPIIFGKTKASIMASENLITASKEIAAPKMVNVKNNNLKLTSAILDFPNKNFQLLLGV